MATTFQLSIVTPERVFYQQPVTSLVVPGTEGYLGVLANHAPLITALKPGKVEFRDAENRIRIAAVSKGFLEVSGNIATLIADAVEFVDDIDVERAKSAYERALEHIKAARTGKEAYDVDEEQAALERAANRIRLYHESH